MKPTEIRKTATEFAQEMERVLRANDRKGGWEDCSASWLLMRLRQEVEELSWALRERPHFPGGIMVEAADVANFAMMLWDVVRHEPIGGQGDE